jgi:hypothetical protein
MNRKSLFGRFVNQVKGSAAERPEYARMRLEPLEDRKMLVATIYVNDNWVNVTDPGNPVQVNDVVVNSLDAVNPGGIIATYGTDAFGTVDGTSVAGFSLIYDAIQAVDSGGQINLLDGTYTESDIVIDKPLIFQGASGATSLIRPEVVSSGATSNFGVGTRSGIIIYSPSVTVSDVTVDGNANGSLGAGLNFHHGITTLYDTQNGGDYSSLRNGNLPVIQLGTIANQQRSIPALRIQNVTVNDVFWHGITMGAPAGKVYGESSTGLDIQNAVVNNVGNSADENRIGILTLNLDNSPLTPDANVLNSTVNGAGVGIALLVNGPPFDFADNDGARSKAGVALSTVNNAVFRAFDIRWQRSQLERRQQCHRSVPELRQPADRTIPDQRRQDRYPHSEFTAGRWRRSDHRLRQPPCRPGHRLGRLGGRADRQRQHVFRFDVRHAHRRPRSLRLRDGRQGRAERGPGRRTGYDRHHGPCLRHRQRHRHFGGRRCGAAWQPGHLGQRLDHRRRQGRAVVQQLQ